MKPLTFTTLLLVLCAISGFGQNIGFNDNGSDPNTSAMVDVYSTTKGMLIPRVSLDSTLLATPVTTPATSLLVYNTATVHDVTPGYYYWTGSLWNRLETSADGEIIYEPVVKTSNATLLKTETMVLVSGNTTITLPAVSAADDGLEIVIKHFGTHTDLVKVKPEPGKLIDANDSIMLTRWNGKALVAYNGNWIVKYKETRADNLLDVSSTGSFTTIDEVVDFLDAHMCRPVVVRLGAGTYDLESTISIDLPYPVTFQGLSFGETIINCPSGDTAFVVKSECYFKMQTFQAGESGGVGVSFSGSGTYNEIKDCFFNDFTKGVVIRSDAELWLFETDFYNCTSAGVEVDAGSNNNIVFRDSECDYYNCENGISLVSAGSATEVSIMNTTFYNVEAGQTGIYYVPTTGSNNFRFNSMIVQNNSFNNVGSFYSGFDFSRSDGRDADVFMENNAGKESKAPHCKIIVANSTTTTTITNANSWYKAAAFTSYSSYTTKWKVENNKITYLSSNVRDVVAFISGNIRTSSSSARTLNIAIVVNGVTTARYGETTVRIPTNNGGQSFQFSTNVYIEDIGENDYLEIYLSSGSSSDVLTIDDLNWYTEAN